MRRILFLFSLILIFAASGCVWKSDFESKVLEADNLQKDKMALQAKVAAKDKEIADLNQKIDQLTKEKAALQQQNADIRGALEGTKNQLAKELVDVKGQLAVATAQRNDLQGQRDQMARERAAALEEKDRAIAQVEPDLQAFGRRQHDVGAVGGRLQQATVGADHGHGRPVAPGQLVHSRNGAVEETKTVDASGGGQDIVGPAVNEDALSPVASFHLVVIELDLVVLVQGAVLDHQGDVVLPAR